MRSTRARIAGGSSGDAPGSILAVPGLGMEGGFVGARVSRLAALRLVPARGGSGDPCSETDAVGISGVSAEGDVLVLDFPAPCLATEFVEIFSDACATTIFVLFVA